MTLRDGLADGTYTVAWRVVSADSHPISGAFTFSIGKPSTTTAAVAAGAGREPRRRARSTTSPATPRTAPSPCSSAGHLRPGLPPAQRRCRCADSLRAGWWVLLASTVALLLLRGPYERGTGPSTAFDPELIENTLTTRPGWALLARLALLAGAAVFLVRIVPRCRSCRSGGRARDGGRGRGRGTVVGPGPCARTNGGGREPEARRGRGRRAARRGSGAAPGPPPSTRPPGSRSPWR